MNEQVNTKKWLLAGIVFILITIAIFFVSQNVKSFSLNLASKTQQNEVVPTPTPFPFQEMTIPYLRSKSYTSRLGEMQKIKEASEYTGYLTNYTSDGLNIHGYLTIPRGDQPLGGWPAIVFIHGYVPPSLYQTTQNYTAYVDYLARSGFVVFKIDLRGHGDSEGEPGGGYYSSDYIIDTLSAYDALEATDFVNPQKIGLWGHSMAGNVVLRSWAVKPTIPAVNIWAGAGYTYEDLRKYGLQDNSYRPPVDNSNRQRKRAELFNKYGQYSSASKFWKLVVPTNYLSDIRGAVQLNHATDDPVVNIGYSRDLNALLDETTIVHELNEYSSGGHNISGTNFNRAMQNTVEFFRKYLDS